MFKKVTITTACSAVLLFGGTLMSVGASADMDSPSSEPAGSQEKGNNITNLQEFLDGMFNDQAGNRDKSAKPSFIIGDNANKETTNEQTNSPEAPAENQDNAENQGNENEEPQTDLNDANLDSFEEEVVSLTNDEREKQGLDPLKADTELSDVARDKSEDMQSEGYFSHDSPTYGSPFDMMDSYDIDYQTAGENIARGQSSAEEVVDGWMNSEGHRENILNPDFTHIGVGYDESGNHWTQQFIGK